LNITEIDHLGNVGYLFLIEFLGLRVMSNKIQTSPNPDQ
jgi:hypothetical protein